MADTHVDFVEQCVDERKVRVRWIATKENLADIMTKPLPLDALKYLRDKTLNQSLRVLEFKSQEFKSKTKEFRGILHNIILY